MDQWINNIFSLIITLPTSISVFRSPLNWVFQKNIFLGEKEKTKESSTPGVASKRRFNSILASQPKQTSSNSPYILKN